jgi:hypothetical protein
VTKWQKYTLNLKVLYEWIFLSDQLKKNLKKLFKLRIYFCHFVTQKNTPKKSCKKGNSYFFNIKELINELRNKNLLTDDFDNIEDEPEFKEDDNNDLDQI